jgi:hypothetical protein
MPTPYIPTIVVDTVIDALVAFLQPFVGSGTPIVRGQQNRVPPPVTAFVKVTEILQDDLETPTFVNNGTTQQASITTPTQIDIQVDFYGISSGDWCKAVKAVFRSPYAPDQFPDGIAPLYSSNGHQAPLVTGEEQYEFRWVLTASLQYNPSVYVPQQSATELHTSVFEDLP